MRASKKTLYKFLEKLMRATKKRSKKRTPVAAFLSLEINWGFLKINHAKHVFWGFKCAAARSSKTEKT